MTGQYILMAFLGMACALISVKYAAYRYTLTPNYGYVAIGGAVVALIYAIVHDNLYIVCIDILLSSIYSAGAIIDKHFFLLPDLGCIVSITLYCGYILLGLQRGFFLTTPWSAVLHCYIVAIAYYLLQRLSRGGVGDGDIKWSAVMALWIPTAYIPTFFFLPFLLGSLYISWKKLCHKKVDAVLPFGPFLAMGAMLTMLCAYGQF